MDRSAVSRLAPSPAREIPACSNWSASCASKPRLASIKAVLNGQRLKARASMPAMSTPQTGQKPAHGPAKDKSRSDAELIEACLGGDGDAWEVLVNRYRRLIYSIPFKWGLQREDANEIFQAVWLDCFQELH